MGTLQQYAGQELIWESSTTAKRTYELHAGEHILATLAQPSAWNQRRIGTSDEGQFTFARIGFFRQRIVIADAASDAELVSIPSASWSRQATLTLPDGRTYHWRKAGFWGMTWTWLDGSEQPLMTLRQFGAFRVRCAVTIEPAAAIDSHLALLAQLGWFQMLLIQADTIAATAASTTAATSSV